MSRGLFGYAEPAMRVGRRALGCSLLTTALTFRLYPRVLAITVSETVKDQGRVSLQIPKNEFIYLT